MLDVMPDVTLGVMLEEKTKDFQKFLVKFILPLYYNNNAEVLFFFNDLFMSKLKFSYNLEKDVENYIRSVYSFEHLKHDRKNIEKMVAACLFPEQYNTIKQARSKSIAAQRIKKFLQQNLKQNKDIYFLIQSLLTEAWGKREKCFIALLEEFYEKPFDFSEVTVYFTTLTICPYNYNKRWFMLSFRAGLEKQIQTICHELLHFMFLRHYRDYCIDKFHLTSTQCEILKEALTVFLNTEFRKINTFPDWGYPQERELRDFLLAERKIAKNFDRLLEKAVKFLKQSNKSQRKL